MTHQYSSQKINKAGKPAFFNEWLENINESSMNSCTINLYDVSRRCSMTLGKTIKQLRKETFLSQEQLAAKLNITAQAVSKWENEESYPDILFLPKIAAIFGVKIDELFDYEEDSAYQQIENMLDNERYFTHADFSKAESFLLEQLSTNPNDLHALTVLGDLYHEYAIRLDEKAASYTKQALALNPDDKSLHNTFHYAMHGGRLDWNVANHSELIAYY